MINNPVRLGLVLGFAVIAVGCNGASAAEPEPLQGVIELDERSLGFEVGGRLASVDIEEGQTLEPGAPIAKLDDTIARVARDARAAEVLAARAQVDLIKAGARPEEVRAMSAQIQAVRATESLLSENLERQSMLATRGAAPAARTDELTAQLAQARAQRAALSQQQRALRTGAREQEIAVVLARLQAAETALHGEEERIARYALRADSAGTVLRVHADPGEVVAPGAPVVTLADVEHPYVDVFVPQGETEGLRVGLPARVRVDAHREPFRARIEHVSRRTEFTPRFLFSERERPNLVLRVRVRIDDPQQRLLAGIPAFVTLDRSGR